MSNLLNKKLKLTFKVNAVRTLSSPYKDIGNTEVIHYVLVNMVDLPENIPLDVNPRVPKMTTNVAKRLMKAVTEPEIDFYLNNRGIIISAKSLSFSPSNSEVTIDLGNRDLEEDKYQYGILDGGHTYKAIIQERDKIPEGINKYVRLEVIVNAGNITRLSDARNTSISVSDIALFNLEDKFNEIQEVIKNEPYADKIAYKDNESKPINISEILRLMYAFDIDKFPDDKSAPTQSYSGKAQVFKRYEEAYNNNNTFYKALNVEIPTLVTLYDTIEISLRDKYNQYKNASGQNAKFGRVRGIEYLDKKNTETMFFNKPTQYKVSSGYIFPILGAFRSLLRFDKNQEKVSWIFNPLEMWEGIGDQLVKNTFETSNDPQNAGKNGLLWISNYRIVETQSLRKQLFESEKNKV